MDILYKNSLADQSDQILIDIVESEENIHSPKTVAAAESILKERGYNIEVINDHDIIEIIYPKKDLDLDSNFSINESKYRKFYAKEDTKIYTNTRLKNSKEIIPKGKLVSYYREICRNGIDFIKIKNENDQYTYTPKFDHTVTLCDTYQVTNFTPTILITDFEDYKNYIMKEEVKSTIIDQSHKNQKLSNIQITEIGVFVTIYHYLEVNQELVLQTNELIFFPGIKDRLKLAKLTSQTVFYCIEKENKEIICKIKTPDGRDAILFNPRNNFKTIRPFWQRIIFGITSTVGVILLLIPTFLILNESGWLLIFPILFTLTILLFKTVIATPIVFLVSVLIKRL